MQTNATSDISITRGRDDYILKQSTASERVMTEKTEKM